MGDFVTALGIGLSLAFSLGALFYAVWYGRHTSIELARPDPALLEARGRQQQAIDELLVNQQDLLRRVLELELLVTEYQLGTSALIAQLESMGVTPVWRPKGKPGEAVSETVTLSKEIERLFSMDEMTRLAADAGIPPESYDGDTAPARALELVLYAQRHGTLSTLIAACRKARPKGRWGK